MSQKTDQKIFWGIVLCAFVGMLALNFLTPMESDDYSYLYSFENAAECERITNVPQLLRSGAAHYQWMNGRIVSNILFTPLLLFLGINVFRVCNSVMAIALVLGMYHLAGSTRKYDWKLLATLYSAVFLFVPVFGATMLWITGACNYLWTTTLMLYTLLPFRKQMTEQMEKPALWKQIGYCLLALLAGNGMENAALAMILALVLCIGWQLFQKKQIASWMICMVVCAAVGWALLLISPSREGQIEMTAGILLEHWDGVMDKLLQYSWLLIVWVILFCLACSAHLPKETLALSAIFFFCALMANLAMVIPGYYAQRGAFGWVILLLVACALLLPSLRSLSKVPLEQILTVSSAMLALIVFLQILPLNYNRFRQAQAREADILAQREQGVQQVQTFGIKSLSKYDVYCDGNGFSASVGYLSNTRFAAYFGVEGISLTEELN